MTKFCTQCGETISETARFCNKCGAKLAATQPAQPNQAPTTTYQNPQSYQHQSGFEKQPIQTPYQAHYQSPAAGADLQPNVAAMLCYPLIFVTGILFLVLTPYNKDRAIRFHAYQSIFFTAALIIVSIILNVFSIILPNFLEFMLYRSFNLLAIGGIAWLMYQAYQGIMFKLPIIGDMAENQANKP